MDKIPRCTVAPPTTPAERKVQEQVSSGIPVDATILGSLPLDALQRLNTSSEAILLTHSLEVLAQHGVTYFPSTGAGTPLSHVTAATLLESQPILMAVPGKDKPAFIYAKPPGLFSKYPPEPLDAKKTRALVPQLARYLDGPNGRVQQLQALLGMGLTLGGGPVGGLDLAEVALRLDSRRFLPNDDIWPDSRAKPGEVGFVDRSRGDARVQLTGDLVDRLAGRPSHETAAVGSVAQQAENQDAITSAFLDKALAVLSEHQVLFRNGSHYDGWDLRPEVARAHLMAGDSVSFYISDRQSRDGMRSAELGRNGVHFYPGSPRTLTLQDAVQVADRLATALSSDAVKDLTTIRDAGYGIHDYHQKAEVSTAADVAALATRLADGYVSVASPEGGALHLQEAGLRELASSLRGQPSNSHLLQALRSLPSGATLMGWGPADQSDRPVDPLLAYASMQADERRVPVLGLAGRKTLAAEDIAQLTTH